MSDGRDSEAVSRTDREPDWPSTMAALPIDTSGSDSAVNVHAVTIGVIAPLYVSEMDTWYTEPGCNGCLGTTITWCRPASTARPSVCDGPSGFV